MAGAGVGVGVRIGVGQGVGGSCRAGMGGCTGLTAGL